MYQENGEWKRSDSFGRDELLAAAKALESALRLDLGQRKPEDKDNAADGGFEGL